VILDHIVLRVDHLDRAVAEWGQRFQVVPGGRHDTGSHNALVAFANGSYLELLGFPEPTPSHPWWPLPPGLVDFCVATADLDRDLGALHVPMQAPFEMSRRRPDGYLLRWRIAFPASAWRGRVPFLIEDITPRSERVPRPAANAPTLDKLVVYDPQPVDLAIEGVEVRRSPERRLQAVLKPHYVID
jgi:hypothetical protein